MRSDGGAIKVGVTGGAIAGERQYGSVALAVKEDQDVDLGAESSASPSLRSMPEHEIRRTRENDDSRLPSSSASARNSTRPGSTSSSEARNRSDLIELEAILDDWLTVREKRANRRTGKLPHHQIKRFIHLAQGLRHEIEKYPEMGSKVVHRLQTLAQGVIDRNLQGAKAASKLASSETLLPSTSSSPACGSTPSSSTVPILKDWKLSSRMVTTLTDGLMTYGLFDLAEDMIYLFEMNNRGNKIDLDDCLDMMVEARRWDEVLRYTSGRRRGLQDRVAGDRDSDRDQRQNHDVEKDSARSTRWLGMEMKALNALRRFGEVVRLHDDIETSTFERSPVRDQLTVLCEAMRASLSLKRIFRAMEIRDRLWDSKWHEVDRAPYVTALSEGIRWTGFIPEIEQRVLAEEIQILQDQHRRQLLDSLAKARVKAGREIGLILPFYGSGTDDVHAILGHLTQSSRTIEWMLGSKEIIINADALLGLWDKFVAEKIRTGGMVPSYVLVAFIKACSTLGERNLAMDKLDDALRTNATLPVSSPRYEFHIAVFTSLVQTMARAEGRDGAARVLRMTRRARLHVDKKMAMVMIEAIIRHYDITNADHVSSLRGMVQILCMDRPQVRKRKHFKGSVSPSDQAFSLDKQVLQGLLDEPSEDATDTPDEPAEDSPLEQYHHFLRINDRISLMRPNDFYHAMTRFGIEIDSKRFTEVIGTYLEMSDAKSALEAFNLARMVGVTPGFSMWVTLLWGIMRYENLVFCRKTLNTLRQEGVVPNIAVYTTVGAGLIRSGQYRQSKEFMDLAMKRLDPETIDTIFVSVAFNARCRAGLQTDAIELLRKYQSLDQVALDRKFRESIKRFRAWHKKQDNADTRTLMGAFDELITSDVEERAAESQGSYPITRAWLHNVIRKYWTDAPAHWSGRKKDVQQPDDEPGPNVDVAEGIEEETREIELDERTTSL